MSLGWLGLFFLVIGFILVEVFSAGLGGFFVLLAGGVWISAVVQKIRT